jgi:arylsulfatase A-like enzyme
VFIRLLILFTLVCIAACQQATPPVRAEPERPNILLVVFEDMSLKVGAFGDPIATTPVLDALAEESVRFPNTFTTAGVCAPSRASLITGVHQQTLGAQHMRTHAFGTERAPSGFEIGYSAVPPPDVKAFPELLRQSGYYTFVGYGGWVISNKKDYQFGTPFTIWDEDSETASWQGRAPGQPFFGMVTLATTHESFLFPETPIHDTELARTVAARNARLLAGKKHVTDPETVIVPPWLPDVPEVRAEIATQYDNIAFTEKKLALLLADLERDGLADNTVVIVTTDHGDGFPRAKRSIYDSGIRVPMMIRFPDRHDAGHERSDLVSFVDLAPTILSAAGAPTPGWLQGRDFLGSGLNARNRYVFAASDRMDAWMDRSKAVRDSRYKLIRNYQPDVPLLQPVAFRENLRSMHALEHWRDADGLTEIQQTYFDTPRAPTELYDLRNDPEETVNLADNDAYADVKTRLASAMDSWLARTPDMSAMPEAEMVEQMWPGGEQPVTAVPHIVFEAPSDSSVRLKLIGNTPGASLAWRYTEDAAVRWRIYTEGIRVPETACVAARAIRYGYKESDIAMRCAGENASSNKTEDIGN